MNISSFIARSLLLFILVTPLFGNESCEEVEVEQNGELAGDLDNAPPILPNEEIDPELLEGGGPEVISPHVE